MEVRWRSRSERPFSSRPPPGQIKCTLRLRLADARQGHNVIQKSSGPQSVSGATLQALAG